MIVIAHAKLQINVCMLVSSWKWYSGIKRWSPSFPCWPVSRQCLKENPDRKKTYFSNAKWIWISLASLMIELYIYIYIYPLGETRTIWLKRSSPNFARSLFLLKTNLLWFVLVWSKVWGYSDHSYWTSSCKVGKRETGMKIGNRKM